MNETDITTLRKIYDHEASMAENDRAFGWSWHDVGVYTAMLNRFVVEGWVKIVYKSSKHTHYLLTDAGQAIVAGAGHAMLELVEEPQPVLDTSQLFSDIIGYDNIKEMLKESLQLDKPIHVLLHGPPSICKSKFLLDIEEAVGLAGIPLLGSATSHMGLWDLIAERKPKYLLIDEIEKLALADMAGLLSLMEQGRIIRTKVGRGLDERLTIWVIAAANKISKLPPELLSRFAKFYLREYGATEYVAVVKSVLVRQEGIDKDSAAYIAMKLVDRSHDIRDSIRVARLSKRVGVERAIDLLFPKEEYDG